MPWKECHVMDERLRFMARLLEGEKMAPLCAEFGISRKTGYKIYDRYKDCGARRPHGPQPAAVSASQSAAGADRGAHRPPEARVSRLGRAQDSREAASAVPGPHLPGDQHRPCGARSARPGASPPAAAAPRATGTALSRPTDAERALVRRLQRRIHARRSPVLLSADDHRLRQPLFADL